MGKKGEQNEYKENSFPFIIQICYLMLRVTTAAPKPSISQLEISENTMNPPSCRYTLESWCSKAARDSQAPRAKVVRITHRRFEGKKISATRELHLAIKHLLQRQSTTFTSQEIVRCSTSYIWLSPSWGWLKLDECMLPAIINFQDWCHVPTAIAIIRCTKYGNNFLLMSPIESLHDQLVSSSNKS